MKIFDLHALGIRKKHEVEDRCLRSLKLITLGLVGKPYDEGGEGPGVEKYEGWSVGGKVDDAEGVVSCGTRGSVGL